MEPGLTADVGLRRGADRKHKRSRDRVSVCEITPIADDLGAPRHVLGAA